MKYLVSHSLNAHAGMGSDPEASVAVTRPEKIVMLETATEATTLRLINDLRVTPVWGSFSFIALFL
jgi:hypothetical protein